LRLVEGLTLKGIPGSAGSNGGALVRAPLPFRSTLIWELGGRVGSDVGASTENDGRVRGAATVHGRLSYSFKVGKARIMCFGHVENLLDRSYTSWVQVNDPGGRYFNPAPGRSFLAGLSLALGNDGGHRGAAVRR
jgi:iron complex outermembrane receptor protein